MSRKLILAKHLALGLVIASGCSLDPLPPDGNNRPDGGIVDPGDVPVRIPNVADPEADQRLDDLGIICETTLNLVGVFTEGEPQPPDRNGCWPVGEWRFTATIDRVGCDPQDVIDGQEFVYIVEEIDDSHVVTFPAQPNDLRVNFKISTDGSGDCNGSLEHYGLDLRVKDFKPRLAPGQTGLQGVGTHSVWLEDPF